MRGATKLFRIFGIDIKLHFSWWFIFILIAWALSVSFFPNLCAGKFVEGLFAHEAIPACANLSPISYWFMGISASILLFLSVLLHELSHSLVAKAKRIKVESITLFFFGGVAGITREDMKPSSELQMALAGPLFSIFLGVVFLLINQFYSNGIITAISFYLYFINFFVAGFNLIPGFPLDGGRAFRAILYAYYKDLKKATRIAATGGKVFAGYMILEGILNIFGIQIFLFGGLWFILLGVFLYFIAGVSYEQVIVREVLSDIKVRELISKKPVKLQPSLPFADFVKRYSNTEEEVFIVEDKSFTGLLDLKKIDKMPLSMQKMIRLKQISLPLARIKSLKKDDNAYTAFRKLAEQNLDSLPVVENDKLLGVVTRKKIMHRLVWELKFGSRLSRMEKNATRKAVSRIKKKDKRKVKKKAVLKIKKAKK